MATLEVIFEATLQVLSIDGPHRLTTTRVAERAGLSVGTLYQYFPHKQALFYALNEHYLKGLAAKIEAACRAQHGSFIGQMIETLVATYWSAKTERPDVTRALYRSVAELDNAPLIETFAARVDAATTAMFISAADAVFNDLRTVNLTLLTVIFGTVRSVFERDLSVADSDSVHEQLVSMCLSYIDTVRTVA